jgi:hypothetical protein
MNTRRQSLSREPHRRHWLWLSQLLLLLSAVLLGAGLVSPAMTIQPKFGPFDGWVRLLNPSMTQPSTYSLLSGIMALMRGNNLGIGLLLLGFSVVFPTLKLALTSWATARIARGGRGGASLWLAHHGGKLSMLDLLVIAILIVAIKGLPGGSTIDTRIGIWLFSASVLFAMTASTIVGHLDRHSARNTVTTTPLVAPSSVSQT